MCCVACAVSLASWLLFTGVPAQCVVLHVPFPWPLGYCSLVCLLSVLCCMCGFLGHLAPVHWCACSVCCVACAVFLATWLLSTGVQVQCAVFALSLTTWLLFSGVPAPCAVSAVSLATWLLFTTVAA